MSGAHTAIPFDTLVEYWLGETDAAATDAIDEHLLGCDACGAQLDEVIGAGRRRARGVRAGLSRTVVSAPFLRRLAERGVRVREYRVPHNGSVACSVAPDDDCVVSRLQAPLGGVTRLDVLAHSSLHNDVQRRHDIPFDPDSGEVLIAPTLLRVRQLPAARIVLQLVAVDAHGERAIGDYTLNHSPWPAAGRL